MSTVPSLFGSVRSHRGRRPPRAVRDVRMPLRTSLARTDGITQGRRLRMVASRSDSTERRTSEWVRFNNRLMRYPLPRICVDRYGHLCDCRPGWEAKARPRVPPSTHSSQRLVSATCQPLQLSRSSAENSSSLARPPDYDESSARRDHQASAAVIALSASGMASPTSPAVAAQCKGTRARAPGSHRYSSRVNGSGAVLS